MKCFRNHHPLYWLMLGALPATGAAAADVQLEEIVVTSQFREQNLQDVPVSVTAFTAEQILSAGIESTQDFINLTPNVTMDDSFTVGNTFLQVRGVAQINNADSPMAIVIDGVPQNNQKQFKQDLFDIERIEVLRGPQGSLYGRNAIGGAINIVTKAPTNEFEGNVRLGAGNGGLRKISGSASGAIVDDKLLFRVAAGYKDFDGVTENRFLDEEVDFFTSRDVRAKLLWKVNDRLNVDLRYSHSDADGGCCSDTFIVNPDWDPLGSPNPNRDDFDKPYTNVLGDTTDKIFNEATAKLEWDSDQGRFSYIFGWSDVEEEYFADLDFTDNVTTSLGLVLTSLVCEPLFATTCGLGQQQILDVELMSHELRFTSPDDRRLRYILGAYYLETDRSLATIGSLDLPGTVPVFSPDNFIPFLNIVEDNDNTAWAVFGQVEYDLMKDLELAVGLRYDEDKREHTGIAPVVTSPKKTFKDLQPRVILTRRWTDDFLAYGGYSRGFRSGGFNSPATASRQFNEETLDNFEVGFKSTWLDNRLLVNGAAFYAKSDDFQFFFVDVSTASQVIDNIDEVDIVGGELEAQAIVGDRFSLFGSFGYTDTEIEKSRNRPQDEGNHAPKNQKFTLNVGGEYRLPVTSTLDARLRLDYEHRGRKYWHPDNLNPMDPFGLLNGRVTVESEKFSVVVWARNIFDHLYWEDYNASAFSGLPFGDIGFLSRGRTYGADFEYRF